MAHRHFSCIEAKQLDMVEYLQKLGFSPQRIHLEDYWYLSPFREEKTASFKINRKINAWYDHGIGQGGNLIDFGLLFHHCSIPELLSKLTSSFLLHQPSIQSPERLNECKRSNKIQVIATKPLAHLALCRYLKARGIPFIIAENFVEEVSYSLYGRTFFAIGFKNDAGGYELRNQYFKGGSSPKDVTIIQNQAEELSVFEGFFSFLSYQTLTSSQSLPLTDFLILNSLSFFKKKLEFIGNYKQVNLFLDNDVAGKNWARYALGLGNRFKDESIWYEPYKDLNDFIIKGSVIEKETFRVRENSLKFRASGVFAAQKPSSLLLPSVAKEKI